MNHWLVLGMGCERVEEGNPLMNGGIHSGVVHPSFYNIKSYTKVSLRLQKSLVHSPNQ